MPYGQDGQGGEGVGNLVPLATLLYPARPCRGRPDGWGGPANPSHTTGEVCELLVSDESLFCEYAAWAHQEALLGPYMCSGYYPRLRTGIGASRETGRTGIRWPRRVR